MQSAAVGVARSRHFCRPGKRCHERASAIAGDRDGAQRERRKKSCRNADNKGADAHKSSSLPGLRLQAYKLRRSGVQVAATNPARIGYCGQAGVEPRRAPQSAVSRRQLAVVFELRALWRRLLPDLPSFAGISPSLIAAPGFFDAGR